MFSGRVITWVFSHLLTPLLFFAAAIAPQVSRAVPPTDLPVPITRYTLTGLDGRFLEVSTTSASDTDGLAGASKWFQSESQAAQKQASPDQIARVVLGDPDDSQDSLADAAFDKQFEAAAAQLEGSGPVDRVSLPQGWHHRFKAKAREWIGQHSRVTFTAVRAGFVGGAVGYIMYMGKAPAEISVLTGMEFAASAGLIQWNRLKFGHWLQKGTLATMLKFERDASGKPLTPAGQGFVEGEYYGKWVGVQVATTLLFHAMAHLGGLPMGTTVHEIASTAVSVAMAALSQMTLDRAIDLKLLRQQKENPGDPAGNDMTARFWFAVNSIIAGNSIPMANSLFPETARIAFFGWTGFALYKLTREIRLNRSQICEDVLAGDPFKEEP